MCRSALGGGYTCRGGGWDGRVRVLGKREEGTEVNGSVRIGLCCQGMPMGWIFHWMVQGKTRWDLPKVDYVAGRKRCG